MKEKLNYKDVRCGNIVERRNVKTGEWMIHKITEADFYWIIEASMYDEEWSENHRPVELNYDKLTSFEHHAGVDGIVYFEVGCTQIFAMTCYDPFVYFVNGKSLLTLKYVHQLQNLYHALSGGEELLKIRPITK